MHRPPRHRNAAVCAAYVRPAVVPGRFCDSFASVVLYDSGHQRYFQPPGGTIAMQSSPRIAEARSQVVDQYLASFPDAEWLWWLDADASFEPDVLERLMNEAHATERPIVGALAFGGSAPGNMFPTVYNLTDDGEGGWNMDRVLDYPRDTLVKVGATGCHCVLVHRQVFVAMASKFALRPDGLPNPYPWYSEGGVNHRTGVPIGEDIAFCLKAHALGIPVHVHTGIKTGHVKEVVLDEKLWLERGRP